MCEHGGGSNRALRHCLPLTHVHVLYVNRDKCVWATKTCHELNPLRFLHQLSLLNSSFYPETETSRCLHVGWNVPVFSKGRLNVYSCWITRKATEAISQIKLRPVGQWRSRQPNQETSVDANSKFECKRSVLSWIKPSCLEMQPAALPLCLHQPDTCVHSAHGRSAVYCNPTVGGNRSHRSRKRKKKAPWLQIRADRTPDDGRRSTGGSERANDCSVCRLNEPAQE